MDQAVEKRPVGRPPSRKALLTLRLEQEIVDYFRATKGGAAGWLQGVNDALKTVMHQRQRQAEKRALKRAGPGAAKRKG